MKVFYFMLISDMKRYNCKSLFKFLLKSFVQAGISAVVLYRLQSLFTTKFLTLAKIISRLNYSLNGIDFVIGSNIDGGLLINHPIGIVIGNKVNAGKNLEIMQNVTLGQKYFSSSDSDKVGNPTIGDNVSIGCGSTLLGEISVGNFCVIGAGTILLEDVPANSTAVGNPAKILSN